MSREILKLENITKIYDNGILANNNINLSVAENEVHAIVGENGAGKSTLMKIIFGMEQPTTGSIYVAGEKTQFSNVDHAIKLGIGMVHQHFMLVESMDAVDNIMLGIEPRKGFFMNKEEATKVVKEIADKYMFKLIYDQPVSKLSIGMKQKIEIIKALVRGAKILILDEPTAVLTPQETEELFTQLKVLTNAGHTILFISHKLNEVKQISDRITVIRKGETKGTLNTKDTDLSEITRLMVGRNVSLNYDKNPVNKGNNIVEVKNVNVISDGVQKLKDVSFDLPSGMIVGIAGVEGNGQNEIIEILSRAHSNYSGDVLFNGSSIKKHNVKSLRNAGFGFIPEDRMHLGIAGEDTILDNVISTRFDKEQYSGSFNLKKDNIANYADQVISDFEVAAHGHDHIVGFLSGGNIQKVVVGRECGDDINFLIAEQPTRGVDLGAAEIIHNKLLEMRDRGCAIILVSADLNEIVELSDQCLVFYNGEIVAKIENPKSVTEQELGEYMLGIKRQGGEK